MNVFTRTDRLRRRVGVGRWLLALAACAALVFAGCDLVGDDEDEQQQSQQQAQAEQASAAPAAPAAAASTAQPSEPQEDAAPPPPPAAQGGGEGADAYSIVFPSLAQVRAANGAVATGLVTNDGYVLVDGNAVDGAMSAHVLLSNGETLEGLSVLGHDRFTGLAWLGPVDATLVRLLPGARLGDGEGVRPGSSVFAVGYGSEDGADDQPAVYSGVLSGINDWEPGQRTFLQTDAWSAEMTGGMVLVDGSGTVIGFAPPPLVALGWYVSTGDLARSLPPSTSESVRMPDPASAAMEHELGIGSGHSSGELYIGEELTGERLSLSVTAETPAVLQLIDAEGEVLQESTLIAGATIISLAPSTTGPYRIVIWPQTEPGDGMDAESDVAEPASYGVSSSAPLMAAAEADALAPLVINESFVGAIDVVGDADSFDLAVRAGAVYEVVVQSLLIDSFLIAAGNGLDALDDDSGGGLFGLDSALTLEPLEDGIVNLTVKDYADTATGSYVLTVTQISGDPPVDSQTDAAPAGDSSMAVSAALPSPHGDASLRGEIVGDELVPTLLGIGSELGDDHSLLVSDADGIFEISAAVVGTDQSTARLLVFDADDEVVVSGRVVLNCPTADPCLASAVFISPASEPGPAGVWRVLLQPEGAGSGITEWQIEVYTLDE